MLFNKLFYSVLGILSLVLTLSIVSAGYAVTYATNAFGYSDASTYVTIDMTTHVDHYIDYPAYNTTSNYYYNGGYYYSGAYYYYPNYPTNSYNYYQNYSNYYVVSRPVYYVPVYQAYTYVQPVYYANAYTYPTGWYYS